VGVPKPYKKLLKSFLGGKFFFSPKKKKKKGPPPLLVKEKTFLKNEAFSLP